MEICPKMREGQRAAFIYPVRSLWLRGNESFSRRRFDQRKPLLKTYRNTPCLSIGVFPPPPTIFSSALFFVFFFSFFLSIVVFLSPALITIKAENEQVIVCEADIFVMKSHIRALCVCMCIVFDTMTLLEHSNRVVCARDRLTPAVACNHRCRASTQVKERAYAGLKYI